MGMSRDRVHFEMRDNNCNHHATANAASRAFGMSACDARRMLEKADYAPVVVVCRPSQFARFMIYRSEHVKTNTFAQFKAVLKDADDIERVDVSGNPRC
jgi:hypothetical protein